ncbi:hypothetical protein [Kordiimonas sp.]|uniref:hypothetical protein n=1 Tax=Kordiimonas sp. TaxID=1970157 RepID=UPI003B51B073
MANKRLAVFGHSHTICLIDALAHWRFDEGHPEFDAQKSQSLPRWPDEGTASLDVHLDVTIPGSDRRCFVDAYPIYGRAEGADILDIVQHDGEKMRVQPSALYRRFLDEIEGADVLVSCLFGNEFALWQYVANLPPYDFIPVGAPTEQVTVKRGVPLLDRQYIIDRISPSVRQLKACLLLAKREYSAMPIVHVMPSPPIADVADASSLERFEELFDIHGVVSKELRLKWYQSYVFLLEQELLSAGLMTMRAPANAQDEKGFLKPEYLRGLTHGNGAYGKLVWAQLAEVFDRESLW